MVTNQKMERLKQLTKYYNQQMSKTSSVSWVWSVTSARTLPDWQNLVTAWESSPQIMCHLYGDLNILVHLMPSKLKLQVPTMLKYYDPQKKSLFLQTHVRLKGLVTVLLQEGYPDYFATKSLQPTQNVYVAIELESLAVAWVMEKFSSLSILKIF